MLDPRLNHAVMVARMGSFTKAAQQVGVTQSAITKSIADLEAEVGFALFHRTARGTLLTEEGRLFVEKAGRLLSDARELMRPRGNTDPYAGLLKIGVCPASLEWLLAKPVALLNRTRPSIRFDVAGGKFETIVQQLRNATLDIAVGFEDAFAEWGDIVRMPIKPFRVAMFVRKGHPLDGVAEPTLKDISHFPFVSPSDSKPYGDPVRAIYSSEGRDPANAVHSIDFFPIVREVVANSDAIAVGSQEFMETTGLGDRFTALPGPELFPPTPMCCATRARWEPRPAARAFLSVMRTFLPASDNLAE